MLLYSKIVVCLLIKLNEKNMGLCIGFATEFYTLWDVVVEPVFRTDAYGNHWHVSNKTNFNYLQNVSKDIENVKSQYPSVPIDDSLRGHSRSFSMGGAGLELSPVNILWFGKYSGQDLNEVAKKDLSYCMWLLENAQEKSLRDFVKELPEVVSELLRRSIEKESFFNSVKALKESGVIEITIESNPHETIISEDSDSPVFVMRSSLGHGSFLYVIPHDVKYMAGSYSYPEWYMPVIDGKAKRLKGKTIKANVELLYTKKVDDGYKKGIHQYVKILNLVK